MPGVNFAVYYICVVAKAHSSGIYRFIENSGPTFEITFTGRERFPVTSSPVRKVFFHTCARISLLILYTQAQYAFSLQSACPAHIQSVRWRAGATNVTDCVSLGWPTASALQRDDPPVGQAIRGSVKQFKESGDVEKRKAPRRPCTSEKNVKHVRLSCQFRKRNSSLLVGVCTWAYLKRRFETCCTSG